MKVTEEDTPRWVSGIRAAAAHPMAAVMPGTISNSTPSLARCSASSPPRPKTRGSPDFRRMTDLPSRASRTVASWMAICFSAARRAALPRDEGGVDDRVRAAQQAKGAHVEEIRIPRPRADDVDLPLPGRDPLAPPAPLRAARDFLPVLLEELPQGSGR